MSYILEDLKEALATLEGSVKKELEEIRQSKREVQRLKEQLYETAKGVHYVRDDGCLIL